MNGEELVQILEEDFSVEIGAATKHQWRNMEEISPRILRNALVMLKSQTLHRAIRPIMEFHYLDDDHGRNVDSLRKRLNDDEAFEKLKGQTGESTHFLI
jgi:hypothetical protein